MKPTTQERICIILAALSVLGIAMGMVSLYRDGLAREVKIKNLSAQQEVQDQWLARLQAQVSAMEQHRMDGGSG